MDINKEELNRLYNTEKLTQSEIANRLECKVDKVKCLLKDFGIKKEVEYYKYIDKIPAEKLKELYLKEKKEVKDVAAYFSCDYGIIERLLKHYKISRCKPFLCQRNKEIKSILTKEKFIQLYVKEKKSFLCIAKMYKTSKPFIANLAKEYGIQTNTLSNILTKEKLYELYVVQDLFQKEIAQKFGCEQTSVARLLTQYGITKEATRSRQKDFLQNPDSKQEVVKMLKEGYGLEQISKHYRINWLIVKNFCLENNLEYSCLPTKPENDLSSMYPNFSLKDGIGFLDGKDIDLFDINKKIGIEYNGLPWHTERFRSDKKYHQNKSLLAMEKGCFLYHIFSYDWDLSYPDAERRKPIVISQINNILGRSKKIFARKCALREVSRKDKADFLKANHIQGDCYSAINLGLYYEEKLVAVMTFSSPRFSSEAEYEILRFCTVQNINVVGGASKILKHFIKVYKPKSVLSYSDIAKGRGSLYKKLGFQFIRKTEPNYVWVNTTSRHILPRYKTQKHILVKQGADPNKTEVEIMQEKGYYRVFDCGNFVWLWRPK